MIEMIKAAVQNAVATEQKLAMFHFQVLKHADALNGCDAASFCHDVAVPETYRTEFRQMMALARVIREQGLSLS